MNSEQRASIVSEYLSASGTASNIARAIVAFLSVFILVNYYTTPVLLSLFWAFDILQYLWLSFRATLLIQERITVKTSNSLGFVGDIFYYGKFFILLFILYVY